MGTSAEIDDRPLRESIRDTLRNRILEGHYASGTRDALEPLQGRMHWLFRFATDLPELIREHRRLYEAIASGDPARAGIASREHIQKYRKDYYQHH